MTDNAQKPSNDDWLSFDPLGLDIMDDEDLIDDEFIDGDNLDEEPLDSHDDKNHDDHTINQDATIKMNGHDDNASKPMSNTDMP